MKLGTYNLIGIIFTLCATVVAAASQQDRPRSVDLNALAARGVVVSNMDPLAVQLREQQPEGPTRRGFDIGMATAEGQTMPGPGKQRIHDLLAAEEKKGFAAAVAFSLERNRNAQRAATGAAIISEDAVARSARNADSNVFYRLGFDIATAIFGDPKLGAQGNTSTGPGSLGVRDSLSAAGQRGFNVAVRFHLGGTSDGASGSDVVASARVIEQGGASSVNDRGSPTEVIKRTDPKVLNVPKRLVLSAEASSVIQPVVSSRQSLHQTIDGEIWLTVSYEDGTPFTLAKPEDVRILTLKSGHSKGEAQLDRALSRPGDGIWHFLLPEINPGSHFYLLNVVVDAKAWRTTFEGRVVVRADYTRMPFWDARRFDGTLWDPPK